MAYLTRIFPLFSILIVACSSAGDEHDARAKQIDKADLTGVYVGEGEGKQQDRICMLAEPAGEARFGIVTLENNRSACSGLGNVERNGAEMRFVMAGDEKCVITARIEGATVSFASSIPDTCAYYCSPAATMAGKIFKKTEDTVKAALRAPDLVGNSLCN